MLLCRARRARYPKGNPCAGVERREQQSGYMLLVLMLAVAMLAMTLLSVAPNYKQSIRREREVEMIHRGVQYIRAVRNYYRKNNNSYPPSIERLLETNKVRFLRKRYKDPMTRDGAWRIAHPTDVNLPAANTGLGTSGTPSTTDGGTQNNTGGDAGTAPNQPAAGQVLGGTDMIGVISKSSEEGIHSFNERSKYNEWLFIYLPVQDVASQPGRIPNGPFNPKEILAGGSVGGTNLTTTPSPTPEKPPETRPSESPPPGPTNPAPAEPAEGSPSNPL